MALLGGKLVLILPHGAALRSIVSFAYHASNWTRPSGLFEGGHSGDFYGTFFWLLYFEETLLATATPARMRRFAFSCRGGLCGGFSIVFAYHYIQHQRLPLRPIRRGGPGVCVRGACCGCSYMHSARLHGQAVGG